MYDSGTIWVSDTIHVEYLDHQGPAASEAYFEAFRRDLHVLDNWLNV